MGWLSMVISPSVASYNLLIKDKMVDFPEPVLPRIASVLPFSNENETPFNALI